MDNDDVYAWLDNTEGFYEARVITILACRELYYTYGWSMRTIGTALGVSHEWVRRALLSQTG